MEPALARFPVALLSLVSSILIFLKQFFLRLECRPGRGALMAFPSSQGLDLASLTGLWACFARSPCEVRGGLGAPAAFYSWPASFSSQSGGLFGAFLFSGLSLALLPPSAFSFTDTSNVQVVCWCFVTPICILGFVDIPVLPSFVVKKCSMGLWFCYLVALSLCKNWGRPISMLPASPLSPRISWSINFRRHLFIPLCVRVSVPCASL